MVCSSSPCSLCARACCTSALRRLAMVIASRGGRGFTIASDCASLQSSCAQNSVCADLEVHPPRLAPKDAAGRPCRVPASSFVTCGARGIADLVHFGTSSDHGATGSLAAPATRAAHRPHRSARSTLPPHSTTPTLPAPARPACCRHWGESAAASPTAPLGSTTTLSTSYTCSSSSVRARVRSQRCRSWCTSPQREPKNARSPFAWPPRSRAPSR